MEIGILSLHRLRKDFLRSAQAPREFLFHTNELFYFAFVTIMTIGYGDIAPVTWPARNATILMAILGYTYTLVFIARVVNDLGSVSRARMRKTETKDEAGNTKTGPDA